MLNAKQYVSVSSIQQSTRSFGRASMIVLSFPSLNVPGVVGDELRE
jgi:hypothetical protein